MGLKNAQVVRVRERGSMVRKISNKLIEVLEMVAVNWTEGLN